jgi:hypothetical protein
MAPTTFRKKPVEIEAQQYTDAKSGTEIIQRILDADGSASIHCIDDTKTDHGGHTIRISTLEGDMHASLGDWVICGVQGEFYPCKPDIFEATYEQTVEVTAEGAAERAAAEERATARYFTASNAIGVVALRDRIVALATEIDLVVPDGRNKAIALTALEDVQMRGNRGIFAPEGLR